jgi:hypothetical protein
MIVSGKSISTSNLWFVDNRRVCHFLLNCPLYQNELDAFFRNIIQLLRLSVNHQLLLFGSSSVSDNKNVELHKHLNITLFIVLKCLFVPELKGHLRSKEQENRHMMHTVLVDVKSNNTNIWSLSFSCSVTIKLSQINFCIYAYVK